MRKFIGYDRFEGLEPCRILEALYAVLRLYVNFFQPSVKLVAKKRTGSHVHYEYDKAQTPYQRVMAADTIPDDVKVSLSAQFTTLDPVALLDHIDRLQDELWHYAYRQRVTTLEDVDPNAANTKREGVFQRPASLSRSQTASTAQAVTEDKGLLTGHSVFTTTRRTSTRGALVANTPGRFCQHMAWCRAAVRTNAGFAG